MTFTTRHIQWFSFYLFLFEGPQITGIGFTVVSCIDDELSSVRSFVNNGYSPKQKFQEEYFIQILAIKLDPNSEDSIRPIRILFHFH